MTIAQKICKISAWILLAMLLTITQSKADSTLDVVTNLSFGTFGMAGNYSVRSIVVTPAGDATYSPRVIPGLAQPEAGEYLLDDLTPDTALAIVISDTTLNRVGGGPSPAFIIKDFTHNNPTTNSSGDATLRVGATLETTGSGVHYFSGNYTGTMDITIFF